MIPHDPKIRCLYCRETSHIPRLAWLLAAAILALAAAAAIIEEMGFRTLFDFGPYPRQIRVFVIICTIVYFPLLVALAEFGRALYLRAGDRALVLVRQGLLIRRTTVFELDSTEALSVRIVTRMRGNVSEVGLHLADGREAHLFSYHSGDEDGEKALSVIVSATGLQIQ